MIWSAIAPSNLALIKYMGKEEKESGLDFQKFFLKGQSLSKEDKKQFLYHNQALNSSLSYTLNHFITKVQIEESNEDQYFSFQKDFFSNLKLYRSSKKVSFNQKLSQKNQKRFLDFFQFLKRFFVIPGQYIIRSQNNFPFGVGAASSASSFSALTLAVFYLARDKSVIKEELSRVDTEWLARLSRSGSGSSCRSFFSPWVLWSKNSVHNVDVPWKNLIHEMVLIQSDAKIVSSSLAHQLVKTSPYFKGRTLRAEQRLKFLCSAFQNINWKACFEICYEEFMDMHVLFETSQPAFKYKTLESEQILSIIKKYWNHKGQGPLVTMDAGANIHLLYQADQKEIKKEIRKLLEDYTILSSEAV